MKITIQVSDEQGEIAQKEFTVRPDEAETLPKVLERAFAFLRREAPPMVRRREPAAAPSEEGLLAEPPARLPTLTVMETLQGLLHTDFVEVWFTSLDVQDTFRKAHGSVSLSTVSTYLARLHRAGALERGGNRRRWTYRLVAGRAPGGAQEISLP